MPSGAMRDLIHFLRDKQKASAGQAPPTLEQSRAALAPAGRLHPLPDDVRVTEGSPSPCSWRPGTPGTRFPRPRC